MTPPDRPRITPELVDRFAAYYHHTGGEWGSLHIVLADGNIQRDHVQFCMDWAVTHADPEGADLARVLLAMSKSQRGRVGRFAEMPSFTTLDTWVMPDGRTAHVTEVPMSLRHDPRRLVGDRVRLDRRVVRVLAVEARAIPWRPGANGYVSLVVESRRERKLRHEAAQQARQAARTVELSVTEDGWLREVYPRAEVRTPPPGHPFWNQSPPQTT